MKFKVLGFLGVMMSLLCVVSIPALAQQFPFYVLDGWGGVHAGGGAPTMTPATAYFGWDIAKAIEYVPVGYNVITYGEGCLVLDGYGGIHKGGTLASIALATTPYFGWDIARDIAVRLIPPRVNNHYVNRTFESFTNTTYQSLCGVSLILPDDGNVTMMGSVLLRNLSSAESTIWNFGFGVDTTTAVIDGIEGYQDVNLGTITVTLCHTTFLTAGRHMVYLIAKNNAAGTPQLGHSTITAILIDQGASGMSVIETGGEGNLEDTGSIK